MPRIGSIDQDAAAGGRIKALDQLRQRALAAAGRTGNDRQFTGRKYRKCVLAPVGCSSNLCPYEDHPFPHRYFDGVVYLNLSSDPFAFPESEWDRIVLELQATKPEDGGAAMWQWLKDNNFQQPDAAKPIFDSHVQKGDVFVAVKLKNNAGIDEIKPVSLTMDEEEPCVPLRLTSIASTEDLAVQMYIAGAGRAIPKNHLHVVVNPLKFDWFGGGSNYGQVLSQAIDEAAVASHLYTAGIPDPDLVIRTGGESVAPAEVEAALRRHLEKHGFGDIEVEAARDVIMNATRLDPDNPWAKFASRSIEQTAGRKPHLLPNLGGSLPNEVFTDILGLPTVWVPHSYGACSQHAPNEHLLAPVAREGLRLMAGLFWDLGAQGGRPV